MRGQELNRQLQRINALFDGALRASDGNVELLSHWAKYLCVLVAGFLEFSLQDVYSRYASSSASEPVRNYSIAQLSRIQNPKAARFIEISGSFRKSWGEQLDAFLANEGRKDAIDSIMHNRHLIAHGKDSSITVAALRGYLDKSAQVITFLEDQCGL